MEPPRQKTGRIGLASMVPRRHAQSVGGGARAERKIPARVYTVNASAPSEDESDRSYSVLPTFAQPHSPLDEAEVLQQADRAIGDQAGDSDASTRNGDDDEEGNAPIKLTKQAALKLRDFALDDSVLGVTNTGAKRRVVTWEKSTALIGARLRDCAVSDEDILDAFQVLERWAKKDPAGTPDYGLLAVEMKKCDFAQRATSTYRNIFLGLVDWTHDEEAALMDAAKHVRPGIEDILSTSTLKEQDYKDITARINAQQTRITRTFQHVRMKLRTILPEQERLLVRKAEKLKKVRNDLRGRHCYTLAESNVILSMLKPYIGKPESTRPTLPLQECRIKLLKVTGTDRHVESLRSYFKRIINWTEDEIKELLATTCKVINARPGNADNDVSPESLSLENVHRISDVEMTQIKDSISRERNIKDVRQRLKLCMQQKYGAPEAATSIEALCKGIKSKRIPSVSYSSVHTAERKKSLLTEHFADFLEYRREEFESRLFDAPGRSHLERLTEAVNLSVVNTDAVGLTFLKQIAKEKDRAERARRLKFIAAEKYLALLPPDLDAAINPFAVLKKIAKERGTYDEMLKVVFAAFHEWLFPAVYLIERREEIIKAREAAGMQAPTRPFYAATAAAPALRIVMLADTCARHRLLPLLPTGDVLVHAGGWSTASTTLTKEGRSDLLRDQTRDFVRWLAEQPHAHKILVAGASEKELLAAPAEAQFAREAGISYLDGASMQIRGVNFFGVTHFVREEALIASAHDLLPLEDHTLSEAAKLLGQRCGPKTKRADALDGARATWDAIPQGTDVLITHNAPFGTLDVADLLPRHGTNGPRHIGCPELARKILQVQPALHIFGNCPKPGRAQRSGTTFVNASWPPDQAFRAPGAAAQVAVLKI
ncbi:Metallophosphoesterase MPPED2 [Hondaea fermentalgiana]|uniref:Metallophosphoesterase MPPED2 n=1 Tax=Hondaea fermentalgiana TaxID=2315210 RepID=A0A2R5GNZ2_9STRA|nr:Metallophosphoesterase MPPED2 [Hondaea fermentalgiana]|eukprot:GBG29594.1 Metallophosphoesterase MPPED2 [Hondaea fermentalgiana]